MGAFDTWLNGLRDQAQRMIGANAVVLGNPYGTASAAPSGDSAPKTPAQEFWNLPAKYAAAKRIKGEVLAAYPGWNNAGDAARHAELSRRMATEIDPVTAAAAGLAHELDNTIPAIPDALIHLVPGPLRRHAEENWHGQRRPEWDMDMHNNAEGIWAALNRRPVDPRNLQTSPAGPQPGPEPYAVVKPPA